MKTATYIEFDNQKYENKTLIDKVKTLWCKQGNKVKDINTLNLYVKPEENAVYFVINEIECGKLSLE